MSSDPLQEVCTPPGHSAKCLVDEISNMILISDCYRSVVMLAPERFLCIYLVLFFETLVLFLEEIPSRSFSVFWQSQETKQRLSLLDKGFLWRAPEMDEY